MRKILAGLVVLAFSGAVYAQGFIPQAEQDARKKELMDYAQKLAASKDSHERTALLRDMVDKDVIRDTAGKARGDGFAVESFTWLYKEGLKKDDIQLRLLAVIGLASLESASSRDPLIEALNDPCDAIQLRAIQAVQKSGVVRAGKDIVLKLRSINPEVAAAAARCLAGLNWGANGPATGPMIDLMAQTYEKLAKGPADDPARQDQERLLEILGRSCGQLIGTISWAPGQSFEDLGKEVAKFTAWWNAKYVPALKDAKLETRRDALAQIAHTADAGAFPAVLDAVVKELAVVQGDQPLAEKQAAQLFIVDASGILSRVSGKADTQLRPTSTTDEIQASIKQWQDWLKTHATP